MNLNQPHQDPALVELQLMRHELAELKDEVSKLRSDLANKRPINIANQVAKGVIIAGAVWLLILFILQAMGSMLLSHA